MIEELFIGLTFIGAGGYVVLQGAMDISLGIDSESWPTVQGEVTERGVESTAGNRGGRLYAPLIRYRFSYQGENYVCDNIKIGGLISSNIRNIALNAINQYHTNQTVIVSVCPEDPTKSVLQAGISKTTYFVIGVGLIFFSIGVKKLMYFF